MGKRNKDGSKKTRKDGGGNDKKRRAIYHVSYQDKQEAKPDVGSFGPLVKGMALNHAFCPIAFRVEEYEVPKGEKDAGTIFQWGSPIGYTLQNFPIKTYKNEAAQP